MVSTANFVMQHQSENEWCWAAVAVSINQFLDRTATATTAPTWTQEALATKVLRHERQIPPGTDCTKNPDRCNFAARLDNALSIVGNLGPQGGIDGILGFENLTEWIDAQYPVCARICWDGGGAHFIALDGYVTLSSGEKQVHVQDPFYGPSFQLYEDLVEDYPPGGGWQDTFLVKQ